MRPTPTWMLIASAVALLGCSKLLQFDELGDAARDGSQDGPVDAACLDPLAIAATPIPPTVILALDGSGSMTQALGDIPRYEAVALGLLQLVVPLASHVRFGAVVFATAPVCPSVPGTPPALDNLAQLQALYASTAPTGQAPLAEGITGATALGTSLPLPGPGRIVFITDSPPTTCVGIVDVGAAVTAARAAVAAGLPLRVVTLGADLTAGDAQAIASAGAAAGSLATFTRVTEPAQLAGGLAQALDDVEVCRFSPDDDQGSGLLASVTLDGVTLSPTDWSPEGDAVRLFGEACSRYLVAPPSERRVELRRFRPC